METHIWWSNRATANPRGYEFYGQACASHTRYSHPFSQSAAKVCRNMSWPKPITNKYCPLSALSQVKNYGTLNYRASINRQGSHLNSRNQSLIISHMA